MTSVTMRAKPLVSDAYDWQVIGIPVQGSSLEEWKERRDAYLAHLKAEGWIVDRGYLVQGTREAIDRLWAEPDPTAMLPKPDKAWLKDGIVFTRHYVRKSINYSGSVKWHEVAGQKVQGSYERRFAERMEHLGVPWQAWHKRSFSWIDSQGKGHWYAPDFYLPDQRTYVEVKGAWLGNSLEKMQRVIAQHPDTLFLIVTKEVLDAIGA